MSNAHRQLAMAAWTSEAARLPGSLVDAGDSDRHHRSTAASLPMSLTTGSATTSMIDLTGHPWLDGIVGMFRVQEQSCAISATTTRRP